MLLVLWRIKRNIITQAWVKTRSGGILGHGGDGIGGKELWLCLPEVQSEPRRGGERDCCRLRTPGVRKRQLFILPLFIFEPLFPFVSKRSNLFNRHVIFGFKLIASISLPYLCDCDHLHGTASGLILWHGGLHGPSRTHTQTKDRFLLQFSTTASNIDLSVLQNGSSGSC